MFFWLCSGANAAAMNAIGARFAGKILRFYSGPIPLGPDSPLVAANVLLGECQLANPAVSAADATGRVTFNTISPDVNCNADGNATFARIEDVVTGTPEAVGDAGVSNTWAILNTTAFTVGGTVTIANGQLQHHNGV